MPRMYELQRLKLGGGKAIRVIKSIAYKWEQLAYGLHFGPEEVETIRRDTFHQTEPACEEVLGHWLRGEHRTPVTWGTLIQSLKDADFTVLAGDLEAALVLD